MIGGGQTTVVLTATGQVVDAMFTDAPRWLVRGGLGAGSTLAAVRRRFPGARLVTACSLNGFGGDNTGLVVYRQVAGHRRFTLFERDRSGRRVRGVWIGRGTVH